MSNHYLPVRRLGLLAIALVAFVALKATADPLPGRDRVKFSQKPMVQTPIVDVNGVTDVYYGHDELSTAYGGVQVPLWDGRFMADDFGDKINGDILHVRWWGSYLGADGPQNPNMPVDKFLISFESDIPADPANGFSRPGEPLLNQVVFRGPLAPGSGTFTEKLVRGPDPVLGEALYEYNAELHLGKEFVQQKDTVYWLKIVALVDNLPGQMFDHYNPPVDVTRWGWHNRDYTIFNNEASQNIPIPPFGEYQDGVIGGANQPIWHFMDDAVEGNVRIAASADMGIKMPDVFQDPMAMRPTHYLDGIDGPAGAVPGTAGIGFYSKDLAFELFTYSIPEPGACVLLLVGCAGILATRPRRR